MSRKQRRIDWRFLKKESSSLIGSVLSVVFKNGKVTKGTVASLNGTTLLFLDDFRSKHKIDLSEIEELIVEL